MRLGLSNCFFDAWLLLLLLGITKIERLGEIWRLLRENRIFDADGDDPYTLTRVCDADRVWKNDDGLDKKAEVEEANEFDDGEV